MEAELNDAIADVIARHEERGLVTKWITLIESLDGDGQRGLWTATSDGLSAWDTAGILKHAQDIQSAQTFGYLLGLLGDDGDDGLS